MINHTLCYRFQQSNIQITNYLNNEIINKNILLNNCLKNLNIINMTNEIQNNSYSYLINNPYIISANSNIKVVNSTITEVDDSNLLDFNIITATGNSTEKGLKYLPKYYAANTLENSEIITNINFTLPKIFYNDNNNISSYSGDFSLTKYAFLLNDCVIKTNCINSTNLTNLTINAHTLETNSISNLLNCTVCLPYCEKFEENWFNQSTTPNYIKFVFKNNYIAGNAAKLIKSAKDNLKKFNKEILLINNIILITNNSDNKNLTSFEYVDNVVFNNDKNRFESINIQNQYYLLDGNNVNVFGNVYPNKIFDINSLHIYDTFEFYYNNSNKMLLFETPYKIYRPEIMKNSTEEKYITYVYTAKDQIYINYIFEDYILFNNYKITVYTTVEQKLQNLLFDEKNNKLQLFTFNSFLKTDFKKFFDDDIFE